MRLDEVFQRTFVHASPTRVRIQCETFASFEVVEREVSRQIVCRKQFLQSSSQRTVATAGKLIRVCAAGAA